MAKTFPFILIFLLSYFTWKPLLNPGYFSMHDDQQVVRLQQMDKVLKIGEFPVRWVPDLGFGYGYPLFNFYPPLVYYTGEIVHFFGPGFIDSIKTIWFLALFGSAISMYFLAKEFFGKWGGLTASMFYLYAPYHAVDAYIRGALAELSSFVWLPLILLFSYKNKPILTGVFLALLMVTHNLIFLPFVGIYIIWSLAFRRNPILPVIIAFGLTAFFWLPALAEKQFTLVDQLLITNLASYKIHFLCPQQLWYSPWGFGGSVAGCADGLSFALGKIYFLVIAVGLVISLFKRSLIGLISFFLLIFSLFMALPYSQFIWDKIPQLWYLQFPWRFLEFAALFSALLAGSLNKKIVVLFLIPLVIFINSKYFVPQKFIFDATDQKLTSDYQIKWVISSSSFEYLPKGGMWKDIPPQEIQKDPMEITNFPGWKVWVDGKETLINDNNKYKLITVSVPQGNHKITAKFTNTPVRTLGNLVSLVCILGLVLYGFRRNKKKNN